MAGRSATRERVANDYYATPSYVTKALLAVEELPSPILEPACGAGHIAKLLQGDVTATDLIYRGYGNGWTDFLTHDFGQKFATIITNPPFNLFTKFIERGLELSTKKLILLGKIQALEGQTRATLLQHSPLRTVYVFKNRVSAYPNGRELDEHGKPWASTMCFAWFVFEHRYTDKPQIEWL